MDNLDDPAVNDAPALAPGEAAYGLYFAHMKGANTRGEKLPDWAELLPTIQEGWAAVEAGLNTAAGK